MAGPQNFPAPVRTIINSNVFNMMAPCPSAEGKWSSFTLNAHNDGISFTVYTRDPQDANNQNGSIKFKAPLPLAFQIFKAIENVASGKWKGRTFENEDFTWVGNKRSDKKMLISTLIVGRDDNGVFISVRSYKSDRPRINFVFGAGLMRSFKILDENGQAIPMAEISRDAAIGWATSLAKVLAFILAKNYKHPEPKQSTGGNSNSNNNTTSSSNASSGGSTSTSDDEMDFH